MPGRNRTNKPNVAHFGPKFPCNSGGLNPSPQRLVEDIGRRLEAERLSRPGVQLRCDLVEPGLADQVEVGRFGRYWRRRPFVFSFEPRCQGLRGSQK